ncbi:hypothetical protein WEI85_35710 [Actinomycetes bacterium KLBMP 9797]
MTEPETFEMPAFQDGGRVDRTGIALVHEGEYIVPAPGSDAVITPGWPGGQVTYTFPVEVEVVGQLSETQLRRVAEYVFDELDTALRARG